jgi:hypothetical protein
MIIVDDVLLSEDLFEEKFVCNLTACKGACCVEGDSGAPLTEEEASILDDIFDLVKPYMNENGIKAVEKQGKYIVDTDGELVTPLVNGKECAYVNFDKNGTAKCTIEQAFLDDKIDFKKPISCHLYPIRESKTSHYTTLNYHYWPICDPARSCGMDLNVKVYKFLKEPLIRRFGKEWFDLLEEAEKVWQEEKTND